MLSFLCDSAGRCHGRGGEESFSVRGRGRTAVRFSHALLSAETLLVCVRIPKVSSSYISHHASRRNEKNLTLSHVHAVFSQSPPSFLLFFPPLLLCLGSEKKKPGRAGRWGQRQAAPDAEWESGFGYGGAGDSPIGLRRFEWASLEQSQAPPPLPKSELIQLGRGKAGGGTGRGERCRTGTAF